MLRASVVSNMSLAAVGRNLGLQDYALIDKKQVSQERRRLIAVLKQSSVPSMCCAACICELK